MNETTQNRVAMAEPAAIPPPALDTAAHHRNDNRMLAVMLGAVFMALLDSTIVNIATPTIRTDLDTTGSALQLIVSGYTIAYAALLVTGARLGARNGFRAMFLFGLITFTAASLACGLAPNSAVLIGARLVQGIGAAMMMPQVYSLIQLRFEGAARARALSLYAATISLGVVVGQVAGGLLVSADLFGSGWRPVFLINVPIGAVLVIAGLRLLPHGKSAGSKSLDFPGLVTLTVALLLLVVPLVMGHERRWPLWMQLSLVASVPMLVVFTLVERAVERRGGAPLVPGRVLKTPGLVPAATAMFFTMAGYAGFLFSFSQHMQSGLGESATRTGLVFAPLALGVATGSLTWQKVPERLHRPLIATGCAVAALGYVGIGFDMRSNGHDGFALPLLQLVVGIGMGYVTSPLLTVSLAKVRAADVADASGVMTTSAQIAQVLGIAAYGSVYLSAVGNHTATASAHAISVTAMLVAVGALAGGLVSLKLPSKHR
ncbi:MFS transporter [Streptomyces sp. NBC_01565]|uniref:MFS transporter n=1 Tax=Streptomyces sp. NBC_01565 TaxID=2975881 RepID=UPI002257D4B6|nr:MFS transporter [Streptomyces sp. NBC_01565]MCX4539196.1 MFS transporter [Streptomyces sp. NBC_01565]